MESKWNGPEVNFKFRQFTRKLHGRDNQFISTDENKGMERERNSTEDKQKNFICAVAVGALDVIVRRITRPIPRHFMHSRYQ